MSFFLCVCANPSLTEVLIYTGDFSSWPQTPNRRMASLNGICAFDFKRCCWITFLRLKDIIPPTMEETSRPLMLFPEDQRASSDLKALFRPSSFPTADLVGNEGEFGVGRARLMGLRKSWGLLVTPSSQWMKDRVETSRTSSALALQAGVLGARKPAGGSGAQHRGGCCWPGADKGGPQSKGGQDGPRRNCRQHTPHPRPKTVLN